MNITYEHENSDVFNADHFEISFEQTGVAIGFDKVNWLKSRKNGVDEKNKKNSSLQMKISLI